MTPEMEQFLSSIRENLNLPDAQAEQIIAELRAHLQSDFDDRLRSGWPEADAAREAMLELGDATVLARELNAEYVPDQRRTTMARNVSAVMLALVGFFAAVFTCDASSLLHAVGQLSPRGPYGVLLVEGWRVPLADGLWWMTQHLGEASQGTILSVLPLLAVGLLVGRIARGRGWVLALVPWFLFWALNWQAAARGRGPFDPAIHLVQPLVQAAALVCGAYVGRRLQTSRLRLQRVLVGVAAAFLALLCVAGFSGTHEGFAVTTLAMAGYACVVGLATWSVLALQRYWGRRSEPSAAP